MGNIIHINTWRHLWTSLFFQSSGAAVKGNKRGEKGKEKKVDDTTQENPVKGDQKGAKGRGSKPASKTTFVFPEHAFSLRALSVVLRVILVYVVHVKKMVMILYLFP